jgi:hypothetical protein
LADFPATIKLNDYRFTDSHRRDRSPDIAPGFFISGATMTMNEIDHDGAARARLAALVKALDATDRALRREECRGEPGDHAIIGKSGWIYPDGNGFMLCAQATPRRWPGIKDRLAFCRLTQDAGGEGCLHLDRLPTPDEADAIREAIGIKRRRHLTAEALASIRARLSARPASGPSGAPGSI